MLLLKLAVRNILRWRRRSILTGLSMTFGYVMASFSLSVAEGSYGNMIDIFTRDHTGHLQVHDTDYLERPSLYKRIENVDEVLETIAAEPGVVAATPRVFAPVLAFGGDKSSMGQMVGIDLIRERQTSLLGQKVFQGSYLTGAKSPEGYDMAMVGVTVAKNLNLKLGDELVLISQGADGSIANDIYIVAAIVGTKTSSERLKIFLPLDAAREFLTLWPVAHEIAIITERPELAWPLAQRLTSRLADPELSVDPWQVIEETFYTTMKADKRSNYVSVSIIMAIVAIGVLNTVLMSAMERMREFGLMRAIGTRPRLVFQMIVTETCMLAVLGCLGGLALALPLNRYLVETGIPIPTPVDVGGIMFDSILGEISLLTLGFPAAFIILSAVVVSLMPGLRAARAVPTKALQAI